MTQCQIVSDAIFGFIVIKPHIEAIIDTPEFQHLRNIWQLGVVPFVYPSAVHSRFEHSIGTYWLASRVVTKLQKQLLDETADIQISDDDVKCVEIAALCHDIGHGPFSHLWDNKVLRQILGSEYKKHEEQFAEMWEIVKTNNETVAQAVQGLNNQLIVDLVNGKGSDILKDIVSNEESGMDVDKWDYLARDSTYLGHSSTNYRADIDRMIHYLRAVEGDDGVWKIAYRDSEGLNMFKVFHMRYYIHQTACEHRKVVAIEEMFLDGIKQCIGQGLLHRDVIGRADWLVKNTDAIFWSSCNEILEFKRILTRDLYKPIFEAVKSDIIDDEETIKSQCRMLYIGDSNNIRITICKFTFGNQLQNPMLRIPFYNKHSDKKRFYYVDCGCHAHRLPKSLKINCNETRVMVFSTSAEVNTYGINNFKEQLKQHFELNNWNIQNIN